MRLTERKRVAKNGGIPQRHGGRRSLLFQERKFVQGRTERCAGRIALETSMSCSLSTRLAHLFWLGTLRFA